LLEILDASRSPAPGMITLSNVKRLFRSQLNLELSETVLGHSRVGELLQDPRLSGVCALQAMGNGQTMVQRADLFHAMNHSQRRGMEHLVLQQQHQQHQQQQHQQHHQQLGFSPNASHSPVCLGTCASNRLFPLATAPPLPPLPTVAMHGPILTLPVGGTYGTSSSCHSYVPASSAGLPGIGSSPSSDASYAPTDRPETVIGSELTGDDFETRSWASGSTGCAETEDPCTPTRATRASLGSDEMKLQSPSTLARCGFVIRNTFIDGSPRAESGAQRRSRSVPKEVS